MKKTNIEKIFASLVLTDDTLKKYMPARPYKKYLKIKLAGEMLDVDTARYIAKAIKNWSIKKGATHYSHWFMPLNGKTAEKQVSFIEINADGKLIEDFSEKSLIKGETDASSFPNGGSRMTFEARGYTVWDYTSPVFIKHDSANNKVVYIPTAFCSYNGTSLDEKTPLLRAIESLNNQALRVLKHLGYDDVKNVSLKLGAEQEYFLVKTDDYNKRLDLKHTGRTLLGTNAIKTQEMCSHYFGMIDDDISEFMNEVDRELWKMGITAKLQHNEVAPSQHEFVPIYSTANIACDQNQLIMEVISRVAKKYSFTALFHEKPFSNINGSGKHANWSLDTDTGINLFNTKLKDKSLFATFFIAMIEAIDRYYKLIRLSTAFRSNDLRLGGDEAPPTLVSVFASEYVLELITSTLSSIKTKKNKALLDTRVKSLTKIEKDFCDRNRTSPFAFVGNKFEFRMVGSSQSVAWPSTCVCAALSQVLKEYADHLDNVTTDKKTALIEMLKDSFIKHERIIFNGNGYDKKWREEAALRGLMEYKDSLSVYKTLLDKDIVDMFEDTKIMDKEELTLRQGTLYTNYFATVITEAKTLSEILNKQVYPSFSRFVEHLSKVSCEASSKTSKHIVTSLDKIYDLNTLLLKNIALAEEKGAFKSEEVLVKLMKIMNDIRKNYDDIEGIIGQDYKPFPSYNDILF